MKLLVEIYDRAESGWRQYRAYKIRKQCHLAKRRLIFYPSDVTRLGIEVSIPLINVISWRELPETDVQPTELTAEQAGAEQAGAEQAGAEQTF